MSDKDNDTDQAKIDDDSAAEEEVLAAGEPEEEPAEDTAPDESVAGESPEDTGATADTASEETSREPAKKGGKAVAWLALLVSAVALVLVGYQVSRDWLTPEDTSADDAYAELQRRLDDEVAARESLAASLENLGTVEQGIDAKLATLGRELDERIGSLDGLPGRMSTLESSVSSLAGISAGARDAWLIAEAEYYMQIANAQLQLANNPHLAALALRMADERVVQLANPALTDVRRAISDELAALDVMEKPDLEGATLTLASLARVVESLPVRGTTDAEEPSDVAADEEESGVGRAWTAVKGAMSGLVRVTPPDRAKLSVLTPDAEYFLRNNIALQLQSARLALLRGEQAVFEQAIDDTSALLDNFFDTQSTQVISTRATLDELRGSIFTTSAPDISGSLRLLRQFRTLSENAQ